MKRTYLISIFCCLLSMVGKAQVTAASDVVVHAPPGLNMFLNKKHPDKKSNKKPDKKKPAPDGKSPETAAHNSQPGNAGATDVKPIPAAHAKDIVAAHPKEVTPSAHSRDAYVRLVSNEKHARTIYSGKGFRVQIYYGPDREKAVKIKTEFMRYYPGVRTYLTYIPPSFRVKVGNFRTREAAMGMLREANSMYSPSMIVPDIITISTF